MGPTLRSAAAAPVRLIGCDDDGTLAPIVDDPASAHPDQRTISALRDLASLPDTFVAIVSGRARRDLKRLLGRIPGIMLIGGHGAEWEDGEISPRAAALGSRLRQVAARFPGAHIESKPTGAAFHYRQVDPRLADRAARSAVAAGMELATRVVHGKRVVEFSTSDADKGSALQQLRQAISPDVTVFIGDDVTDEDAFSVLGPSDVALAVGGRDTEARWRLPSQTDVASLLEELAARRNAAQKGR
jgi:trehalose 6-phosphate phosphatase